MCTFSGLEFSSQVITKDHNGYPRYEVKAKARDANGIVYVSTAIGDPVHATERALLEIFNSWHDRHWPRQPRCRVQTKVTESLGLYTIRVVASSRKIEGHFDAEAISTGLVSPTAVATAIYEALLSAYKDCISREKNRKTLATV
jgi:hypothetical protein